MIIEHVNVHPNIRFLKDSPHRRSQGRTIIDSSTLNSAVYLNYVCPQRNQGHKPSLQNSAFQQR